MLSENRFTKVVLSIIGVAVFVLFLYLMFLASVFAFMAVPFLMLLAFAAFFAPGLSCSERTLTFLRAFVMAPTSVLGLFAPWRALMIIANLNYPALVTTLYPMLDKGNLFIPVLESVSGVCGAIMAVLFGFKSLATYIKFIRVIENLPRSMAGSAAVGLAEFSGIARSVTSRQFVLEDKSGRIRVELPVVKPWNPLDIFPMPDKTDFTKVFFARRGDVVLSDGDPVYVVGSVEADKGAAPKDIGSARLVVRPSSQKERKGIVKRFLFSEFERHDIAEDYRNIFIVTDSPESTVRSLLRQAMFTSFSMTGLFLALSLSLIYIDLTQNTEVRDKILREVTSLVLKVPDETRHPRLPDFRTMPNQERTGSPSLVHLDFDDGIINKGSAKTAITVISGKKAKKPLTWQEALYDRMFPLRLKVPGVFGQPIELDGSSIVDVLANSGPISAKLFTIEFWFMLKDMKNLPAIEHLFVSDLMSLTIQNHGGKLVAHIPCFDKSGRIYSPSIDVNNGRIYTNEWHHVKVVWDGTLFSSRFDRRTSDTSFGCKRVSQRVSEMKLGGSEPGHDNFAGLIDEFYFYDYARLEK